MGKRKLQRKFGLATQQTANSRGKNIETALEHDEQLFCISVSAAAAVFSLASRPLPLRGGPILSIQDLHTEIYSIAN